VYRATDTKLNREVARLWAGRKFRLPRFCPVFKQEVIHSDGCRLLWKGRIRVGGSLPEYAPKLAFPSDGRGLVPTRLVQAQLAHAGDGTAPDATCLPHRRLLQPLEPKPTDKSSIPRPTTA
jgi:hypothetical protein